ncbi:STE50 [Candida oxycetoniae]|uniref:STE50 n=1 Tax=Candida oxycetoniae TaxID=497107 RepID=A0AAI9T088_9ASCO|nr:STE50 [Candida oxycetoniae]KAI3406214.2 STE50 [Candida oxycetoniae]
MQKMNTPQTNDSFLKWDTARVATYFNSLVHGGGVDKSISSAFLDNNIDGSLLAFITTEHLKEIGIQSLKTRLVIKKGITDLIANHYQNHPPQTIFDPEYILSNVNISNNHVTIESLKLTTVLIRDALRKLHNKDLKDQNAHIDSPVSPTQSEIKRLNDNFVKLKTDLIPIIRLLKDSKPLPTPTLDPGPTASSPSYSTYLHDHDVYEKSVPKTDNISSRITTEGGAGAGGAGGGALEIGATTAPATTNTTTTITTTTIPSPASNRFSSGTLLSMGTGKIVSQSIPKFSDPKSSSEFKLQKVGIPKSAINRNIESASALANLRPKLNENPSSNSTITVETINKNLGSTVGPMKMQTLQTLQNKLQPGTTTPGNNITSVVTPLSQSNITSTAATAAATTTTAAAAANATTTNINTNANNANINNNTLPAQKSHEQTANEPLKQLRASTDDSCLKILQQAMKRHHIPRDDWSRYVLVICYGDKERILKLAEKPVVIFKELQELGRHPAIMLRQLAEDLPVETRESSLYEDSRLAVEIPGGTL